tara:strand:+ start:666 stop:995 length:330 start_codon:yes stop_codon:yes gene_type:complete
MDNNDEIFTIAHFHLADSTFVISQLGRRYQIHRSYNSMGESGFEIVDFIFKICVILLADFIGISYELLNIIIFIFAQPILILLFFILWRIERRKNCFLERLNQSNKDPA